MSRRPLQLLPVLAVAVLAGCASVDIDQQLASANQDAAAFTGGQLTLARSDEQRARQQAEADRLLAAPLGQADAVQLALAASPAVQAALAERWADGAAAAQSARIGNPMFSFERQRTGSELELTRVLSFGLFELLTLPARTAQARQLIAASQLQLTASAVDQVTQVRQAWVRAVAARQSLGYARQVQESAEVSAELARRMQAVGNWNRITRARQQLFYADATTRLALAQQADAAAREQLVRLLGITPAQAERLQLPERLPDLPKTPLAPDAVAQHALDTRLDVRLARTRYDAAAQAQGLTRVTSVVDVELALRRKTVWPDADAERESGRGWELGLRLPLFDFGDVRREAMNAQTLAAAQRLENVRRTADSQLRESYATYRSAWDVARHYRHEVVPLRQTMQEENLLRYNGMLIGVFELLADAREQVQTVIAAIGAEQQFWLADAALQASLIGQPTGVSLSASINPGASDAAAH